MNVLEQIDMKVDAASDLNDLVLVTGGAGFIGSHTVEALLNRGYRVRVLDNLSTGKRLNLPLGHPQLELVVGDVLDENMIQNAMTDINRCVHLAAQVSAVKSIEEPRESALINILGFINVLEAVHVKRVDRLVYASSAAVYGDTLRLPLVEDDPPQPINPYGLEKFVDELYADFYQRQYGIRTLGLRYFNVYGPRQDPSSPYSGVISKFIDRLSAGRSPSIYGDGNQTRDFIHVKDVAEANVAALTSEYCGVCNVATGSRVKLLKLVEIMNRQGGTQIDPQLFPSRAGDIRHSCGDNSRLQNCLMCTPHRHLAHGLRELIASKSSSGKVRRLKTLKGKRPDGVSTIAGAAK